MIDPVELNALADGEVSAERAQQLRQMLAASADQRRQFDSILAIKVAIRQTAGEVETHEAWAACRIRLNEIDRTRRTERFVTRYAWALCSVFFVAILVGGLHNRDGHRNSVSVSDMSRIATTLASMQAPPVQDQARERWLDELLGQARKSVDPNRLEINGYAVGQLDMRPVTVFYLSDRVGRVTLLLMPGNLDLQGSQPLATDGHFKVGHLGGQNCVLWSDGQNTWTVVANRGYEDLVHTAAILRQTN